METSSVHGCLIGACFCIRLSVTWLFSQLLAAPFDQVPPPLRKFWAYIPFWVMGGPPKSADLWLQVRAGYSIFVITSLYFRGITAKLFIPELLSKNFEQFFCQTFWHNFLSWIKNNQNSTFSLEWWSRSHKIPCSLFRPELWRQRAWVPNRRLFLHQALRDLAFSSAFSGALWSGASSLEEISFLGHGQTPQKRRPVTAS